MRSDSIGNIYKLPPSAPEHGLSSVSSVYCQAQIVKMLTEYTYVFVIGTLFALLDAYNNGASKSGP